MDHFHTRSLLNYSLLIHHTWCHFNTWVAVCENPGDGQTSHFETQDRSSSTERFLAFYPKEKPMEKQHHC